MHKFLGLVFLIVIWANPGSAIEYKTVSIFSPIDAAEVKKDLSRSILRNGGGSLNLNGWASDIDVDRLLGDKNVEQVIPGVPNVAGDLSKLFKRVGDKLRTNVLRVNIAALREVLESALVNKNIVPVLSLDLFPDRNFKAQVSTIERSGNQLTASGWLQSDPGALFTLTLTGNSIDGLLRDGSIIYSIKDAQANRLEAFDGYPSLSGPVSVIKQEAVSFPAEEPPNAKLSLPEPKKRAALPNDFDSPLPSPRLTTIRIGILYNTNAQQEASKSGKSLDAVIAQAVRLTNQSFKASGINVEAVSAFIEPVVYSNSNDLRDDLTRLQANASPWFSNVASLRAAKKANVIALLVGSSKNTNGCGISVIPEDPDLDYSDRAVMIVAWDCAADNLSFGHELGHLLGARHDRYIDPTEGKPVEGNHGVIFKKGSAVLRDIMAYHDYCSTVLNLSTDDCARSGIWSGTVWPDSYILVPEGASDKNNNNQLIIRKMAPVVGRYK